MRGTLHGACGGEVLAVEVSSGTYDRFQDIRRAWGCTIGELLMLIKIVMTPRHRNLNESDINGYIDRVDRRVTRRARERELNK